MTHLPKRSAFSIALLGALLVTLAVLAYLQYEWSGQISVAEKTRLHEGLEAAVQQFRQDFNRDIREAASAVDFPIRPDSNFSWDDLASRYRDWIYDAPRPDLVAAAYVWDFTGKDRQLYRLDPDAGRLEPTAWPADLESIRAGLSDSPPWERRGPGGEMRAFFAWTFVSNANVMIRPVPRLETDSRGTPPGPPELAGYAFVVVNRRILDEEILPALAQRHFGGPQGLIYDVGVFAESASGETIYVSDPRLNRSSFQQADAVSPLFWDRREFGGRGGPAGAFGPGGPRRPRQQGGPGPPPRRGSPGDPEFGAGPPRPGGGTPGNNLDPGRGFFEMFRGRGGNLPVVLAAGENRGWTLAVKHRLGSLEEAVDSQRRRNLAISFGILILLAVSVAMIIVSTQRAQRLAKLQMDFVAGVSHELRTPLAVIVSAGDNLAEGVVADPKQVRNYGTLVRDEGRRLASMVEQTLSFAAGANRHRQLKVEVVDVAAVIRTTVEEERKAANELGFTIEQRVDTDLPRVRADEQSLAQCLRNLIRNAVKYSGDNRLIELRACRESRNGTDKVVIAVEDHGPGIDGGDLPHIFDPFYRGRAALAAQIHGSGLGLSLTKEALEAMGGTIEVKSTIGKGSKFVIRIPAISAEITNE